MKKLILAVALAAVTVAGAVWYLRGGYATPEPPVSGAGPEVVVQNPSVGVDEPTCDMEPGDVTAPEGWTAYVADEFCLGYATPYPHNWPNADSPEKVGFSVCDERCDEPRDVPPDFIVEIRRLENGTVDHYLEPVATVGPNSVYLVGEGEWSDGYLGDDFAVSAYVLPVENKADYQITVDYYVPHDELSEGVVGVALQVLGTLNLQ